MYRWYSNCYPLCNRYSCFRCRCSSCILISWFSSFNFKWYSTTIPSSVTFYYYRLMALKRFKDIVDAYDSGNSHYTGWRKVPSQVTTAGVWFDLSMSPWNPIPQYYAAAPMIAQVMKLSDQWGFFHRRDVSPKKEHLAKSTLIASSANAIWPYILADYLLYYPFIDEGTTDEQFFDNTNTITRYTDGKGVQMMAVSVAGRTGNARFRVKYTNQDGVEGRITPIHISTIATANGSILTSQTTGATTGNRTSPFLTLQQWDTGVRKIESITMIDVDVWLFALVLVKPLVNFAFKDVSWPVEIDYIRDQMNMPEIQTDAFLSFITCPLGSLSWVTLMGDFTFIFN